MGCSGSRRVVRWRLGDEDVAELLICVVWRLPPLLATPEVEMVPDVIEFF